jgi:hypothetical protein
MVKITVYLLLLSLILGCNKPAAVSTVHKDLTSVWDTVAVLENPDKGWYHHLYDNGVLKYPITDTTILARFPGLDHLYIRVAWSFLEPREGVFDWSLIDKVVKAYVPRGYGLSFRITSKETGTFPGAVGQEAGGVQYATPKWVRDAGAQGTETDVWDTRSWVPVWDDPVYLEKLDNFHRAFAARYGGQPYVRYVDVGSIGDWGEGHTSFSTKVPPTVAQVKANLDLHHRHYKNTLVVVTDDLLYYGKPKEEAEELLQYALGRGFTLRDDSPLVDWYVGKNLETYSVSHPHFFEVVYLNKPVVLELQHYHMIKKDGNWVGPNGAGEIPGKNISGADLFRGALQTMRATYLGYHGFLEEWYADNPDLTGELLNRCGYWFFPKKVSYTPRLTKGTPLTFSVEWLNKGVAPAYRPYYLWVKVEGEKKTHVIHIKDAMPTHWLPGKAATERYSVPLPDNLPPGEYTVKLRLTTAQTQGNRTVEVGVQDHLKDEEGFFRLYSLHIMD